MAEIALAPGTYVVAVSGGVDSVVLLHLLRGQSRAKLIVAHYDHGIRQDSSDDRRFVEQLAASYGLTFVYDVGNLGEKASEAAARDARYTFLNRVREVSGARSIILAHHADDMLETAVLNLMRGTGRKGLSSLQSTSSLYRPLLSTRKAALIAYARRNGLDWHEDSTNSDMRYLRNHVRNHIMTRFDAAAWAQFKQHIDRARAVNEVIDILVDNLLTSQGSDPMVLDRHWFIGLPHDVAREVMASWLRKQGASEFNRKLIERIVVQAKTLAGGKRIDVDGKLVIRVSSDTLALRRRDR